MFKAKLALYLVLIEPRLSEHSLIKISQLLSRKSLVRQPLQLCFMLRIVGMIYILFNRIGLKFRITNKKLKVFLLRPLLSLSLKNWKRKVKTKLAKFKRTTNSKCKIWEKNSMKESKDLWISSKRQKRFHSETALSRLSSSKKKGLRSSWTRLVTRSTSSYKSSTR